MASDMTLEQLIGELKEAGLSVNWKDNTWTLWADTQGWEAYHHDIDPTEEEKANLLMPFVLWLRSFEVEKERDELKRLNTQILEWCEQKFTDAQGLDESDPDMWAILFLSDAAKVVKGILTGQET